MAQYPKDLATLIHARVARDKVAAPDIAVLTRLVEVMYFGSLGTEEGHYIRCWITYVDPDNPDPERPMRVRADRWTISKLKRRIAFSERNLAKLAPAADPWSTAIAVYGDRKGQLFIWGLIDQGIHKSRISVRESSEGGYQFAGLFEIVIQGMADIVAYRNDNLVGRLRQHDLVTREHDVLWSGPVYKKLRPAIRSLNLRVSKAVGRKAYETASFDYDTVEEEWLGTLSAY